MKKFILAVALICLMVVVSLPLVSLAALTQQPPASAIGGSPAGQPASQQSNSCSSLTGAGGLRNVVNCVIDIFGYIMTLLIAASVVLVVYGAFQMISSEEKRAAGKETIMYGIIGLFIMISVWGFVTILDKTFKLSSADPIGPIKLIK